MHVILGALGSLVTILWLLHRLAEMGIDLAGLNPFLWARRRRWKKNYIANPVYKIDSPLEATALLITAVARADGDMCAEEKTEILNMFRYEFHLQEDEAAGLLISSVHLLGKGEEVRDSVDRVLAPSLPAFTREQAASCMEMITRIAGFSGAPSRMQNDLVARACEILRQVGADRGKWT